MKRYAPLPILVLLLGWSFACNQEKAGTTQTTASTVPAPNNTKVNARDNPASVTPMDQGNNPADLETTQAIRRSIIADDTLSTDARNVKIITNNGVITLRGPVASAAERQAVEAKAIAAAGTNRVDDQLDVK